MLIGGVPEDEVAFVTEEISLARSERKPLGRDLFDVIGQVCFKEVSFIFVVVCFVLLFPKVDLF